MVWKEGVLGGYAISARLTVSFSHTIIDKPPSSTER